MNNAIIQDNKLFIIDSIAKHGGKMENIPSISTSCLENTFCKNMQKCGGAVCEKCYAKKYLSMRKTLADKCKRNTQFYTTTEISPADVPKINSFMFRFESFGELQNIQQLKNYCAIAWENEHCIFTCWTKNIDLLIEYDNTEIIWPENLKIIASSRFINQNDYDYYMQKTGNTKLFHAVFTVYTKEYAADHDININCGSKKCINCGRCYSKNLGNKQVEMINEILK